MAWCHDQGRTVIRALVGSGPPDPFGLPWRAAVAAFAGLVLLGAGIEGGGVIARSALDEATLSMHISVAASGLLAIAAALYLVLDDARSEALGRWASRLALLGALGVASGSVLRAIETGLMLTDSFEYRLGLEAPGLIAAAAVLLYLRIEQAWRSRSAGALVLGLAMIALALDAWLMSSADGIPAALGRVVDDHLVSLWHLGGKVGVAASVALVMWTLLRHRLQSAATAMLERLLRTGMSIGLSGFTLAFLSALALIVFPGPTPQSMARCLAGLAVWMCFCILFVAWRRSGAASPRLGLWILCTLVPAALAYVAVGGQAWQ